MKIHAGDLLRYQRNPYPLKGHPHAFAPWKEGALYRVTDVNPMGGKYTPLIAFKAEPGAGDEDPTEWEVGADTVELGFEILNVTRGYHDS